MGKSRDTSQRKHTSLRYLNRSGVFFTKVGRREAEWDSSMNGVLRRIGFSCASFREGTTGGRFAGFFFFFFPWISTLFVGQSVGGRYGRWTGVSSLYGFICLFGAFLIFWGCEGGLATGIFCFFFHGLLAYFHGAEYRRSLGGRFVLLLSWMYFFFLTEC